MSSLEDRSTALKEAEVPDLSKYSLAALSYMLRHEELWPEGFHWYYGHSPTCALGLSRRLWETEPEGGPSIYYSNAPTGNSHDITPTVVADRIDAYRAELQSGR